MFIRKWRYEMQLEAARLAGKKEGRAEAIDQFHGTVTYLETENARLTKELQMYDAGLTNARKDLEQAYKDLSAMQSLLEQQAEVTIPKSTVIWNFAEELACAQKRADVEYYINHDTEKADKLIAAADLVKERASNFGICQEVYEAAYSIYDFRNSGKEGYTLRDGKIVKVEEETAVECPFCDGEQPGDCWQENDGTIHESV